MSLCELSDHAYYYENITEDEIEKICTDKNGVINVEKALKMLIEKIAWKDFHKDLLEELRKTCNYNKIEPEVLNK